MLYIKDGIIINNMSLEQVAAVTLICSTTKKEPEKEKIKFESRAYGVLYPA
jgi:hypothetical protein